jgi:hypothetical protein
MSVGNLKDNGNKGNNFPFQLGALQLLKMINDSITGGGGGGGGLFTEATGLQVLAALQNGQEFEQALVIDLGGVGCPANCPTYIQIRIWDTVNHVFGPPIYYNAAGAVVVPVGPLQFINPQFVLDNILTQVTAINADLDVPLSTRLSKVDFEARINTLGQKVMTDSTPVVIASDQSAVPVTLPTGVSRVPSVQLIPANTALANTTAGVKQLSMRVSGGNGQIGGVAIPNGITLTYTATSENDTVGAVSYQTGAGTTILITYLT